MLRHEQESEGPEFRADLDQDFDASYVLSARRVVHRPRKRQFYACA